MSDLPKNSSVDPLDEDRTSTYEPFVEISKTLLAKAKSGRKPRARTKVSAGEGQPHVVDIHVGGQLKKLRGMRQLSQQALADRLDLTFQQIQKYEGGKNRLSASRMFEISQHLDVHPSYFFEGIDPRIGSAIQTASASVHEEREPFELETDVMAKTESIRMMTDFYRIKDEATRLALRMLVKRIAQADGAADIADEEDA